VKMNINDEAFAVIASSLPAEGKVRMLREIFTSLCGFMRKEGFAVGREVSPDKAAKEMIRFFETEAGGHAAFRVMQMISALAADPEEVAEQLEEHEREDYSRN
jgi:hypothetical protein